MSLPKNASNRTVLLLVSVVLFMGAASFAFVPFYNWFCQVTGFGGVTQEASGSDSGDVILDRDITIAFDANTDREMPWEFKPVAQEMTLKIGETGLAFFEAYNPTDHAIAGQASYNVFPYSAGSYFIKVQCFCFTEQVLQPGERVQMPVSFYVDPDIVNDPEAKYANSITLSYTFHQIEMPQKQAGLSQDGQKTLN